MSERALIGCLATPVADYGSSASALHAVFATGACLVLRLYSALGNVQSLYVQCDQLSICKSRRYDSHQRNASTPLATGLARGR